MWVPNIKWDGERKWIVRRDPLQLPLFHCFYHMSHVNNCDLWCHLIHIIKITKHKIKHIKVNRDYPIRVALSSRFKDMLDLLREWKWVWVSFLWGMAFIQFLSKPFLSKLRGMRIPIKWGIKSLFFSHSLTPNIHIWFPFHSFFPNLKTKHHLSFLFHSSPLKPLNQAHKLFNENVYVNIFFLYALVHIRGRFVSMTITLLVLCFNFEKIKTKNNLLVAV